MNGSLLLEISVILLLILCNGFFALSEISIISSRKPRLQHWAQRGDKKAETALKLADEPEAFLSTVQIGITSIGILTGVFGGATLADDFAVVLESLGVPVRFSVAISAAATVTGITYLSLVIGELTPKSVGLQHAERIAALVAPFMLRLSRLAHPLVRLLTHSTNLLTRLMGIRPTDEPQVTDEEIAIMMREGAREGVFEPEESSMVNRIFRLSDRTVSSLMTPRPKIVWLDQSDPMEVVEETITRTGHSRFPVADADLDHVVGFVKAKDLLNQHLQNQELDPFSILFQPLFVPESMSALDLLERLKEEHAHMALVFDEFGGVEGLVTSTDLLEAIVGDINPPPAPLVIQRADDSWLVDGMLPIAELMELLELKRLPNYEIGHYHTAGGFLMSALGKVPGEGDYVDSQGFRFEVVDMDKLRVDKVLVSFIGSGHA